MTQETRSLADFNSIFVENHGDLTLVPGAAPAIVIEAEPDVLEHLRVEVENGQLHLGLKNWWDQLLFMARPIRYTVTYTHLNRLDVSGSCKAQAAEISTDQFCFQISGSGRLQVERLTADHLEVRISGSADVDLSGSVHQQEIRISGSGRLEAWALESQVAEVHVSGSGHLALKVSERLKVSISGSAAVRYLGSPQIEQSISGSGSVRQMS